jgi:hypothetical protein
MKASAPRYGFQVDMSDAGYVCIYQQNPDSSTTTVLFHPDEVPSLIEALEETRQKALDYVPPPEAEIG